MSFSWAFPLYWFPGIWLLLHECIVHCLYLVASSQNTTWHTTWHTTPQNLDVSVVTTYMHVIQTVWAVKALVLVRTALLAVDDTCQLQTVLMHAQFYSVFSSGLCWTIEMQRKRLVRAFAYWCMGMFGMQNTWALCLGTWMFASDILLDMHAEWCE